MIGVNGIGDYRKEVMEIPSHQQQPYEQTAEGITDDKYVIVFFFIVISICLYNDVNIDVWPAAIAIALESRVQRC